MWTYIPRDIFLHNVGTMSAQCPHNVGTTSHEGYMSRNVGTMSAQCRHNVRTMPAQCRHNISRRIYAAQCRHNVRIISFFGFQLRLIYTLESNCEYFISHQMRHPHTPLVIPSVSRSASRPAASPASFDPVSLPCVSSQMKMVYL